MTPFYVYSLSSCWWVVLTSSFSSSFLSTAMFALCPFSLLFHFLPSLPHYSSKIWWHPVRFIQPVWSTGTAWASLVKQLFKLIERKSIQLELRQIMALGLCTAPPRSYFHSPTGVHTQPLICLASYICTRSWCQLLQKTPHVCEAMVRQIQPQKPLNTRGLSWNVSW